MLKKIGFIAIAFLMLSCGASKNISQRRPATKKVIDKRTTEVAYKKPANVVDEKPKIKRSETKLKPQNKKVNQAVEPSLADKIIWTAVTYKGIPYRSGGTTESGMDCSGLVYTSFKTRGVDLPRTSSMMYAEGYKIPLKKAERGDLLFFKTTNKTRSKVNHVGLVTSAINGEVKFIHSTSSRGVIVTSIREKYWKNAFIEAKRVIK